VSSTAWPAIPFEALHEEEHLNYPKWTERNDPAEDEPVAPRIKKASERQRGATARRGQFNAVLDSGPNDLLSPLNLTLTGGAITGLDVYKALPRRIQATVVYTKKISPHVLDPLQAAFAACVAAAKHTVCGDHASAQAVGDHAIEIWQEAERRVGEEASRIVNPPPQQAGLFPTYDELKAAPARTREILPDPADTEAFMAWTEWAAVGINLRLARRIISELLNAPREWRDHLRLCPGGKRKADAHFGVHRSFHKKALRCVKHRGR
jgi:hypothetical protein